MSTGQSVTKAKKPTAGQMAAARDKAMVRIAAEAEAAARKAAQEHILQELRKLTGPHETRLAYLVDRYIQVTGTKCDGSPAKVRR